MEARQLVVECFERKKSSRILGDLIDKVESFSASLYRSSAILHPSPLDDSTCSITILGMKKILELFGTRLI
jgi:hypothetical protein